MQEVKSHPFADDDVDFFAYLDIFDALMEYLNYVLILVQFNHIDKLKSFQQLKFLWLKSFHFRLHY